MKLKYIIIYLILVSGTMLAQSDKNKIHTSDSDLSEMVIPLNPLQRNISQPINKICPVEGKQVDSSLAALIYRGEMIGFCCDGCDDKFIKNYEHYKNKLSTKIETNHE